MKEVSDFYENYGKEWAEPLRQDFEEHCSIEKSVNYQKLLPNNFKAMSLIDFGCGQGTVLNHFGESLRIQKRIGIDASESMLTFAKRRFPECRYIHGSLESIDSLDIHQPALLMFNDVLEHLPDPKEYLKKAGIRFDYIGVQIPVEKTWLIALMNFLQLKKPRSRLYETEGHLHEFSVNDVLDLLAKSDLKVLQWKLVKPPQKIMFHPYLLDRMKQKKGVINKLKSMVYLLFSRLPYKPICALLTQKTGGTFVGLCRAQRE